MKLERFDFAFASTTGMRHRALGKSNQDAATLRRLPGGGLVLAVADGCSSGAHCEFGARLGVESLARAIASTPHRDPHCPLFWSKVRGVLLRDLNSALQLFENPRTAIYEYLLFTLVACVIEDGMATFVHFGDGAIYINGEEWAIRAEENRPHYVAYALLGEAVFPAEELQFHVVRSLPTADLSHALIGTDGVNEFAAISNENIPGREEPVGPIEKLWVDDRYFTNPQALQRKLNRINPNPPPWRRGLLGDDTTLFVLRKRKEDA